MICAVVFLAARVFAGHPDLLTSPGNDKAVIDAFINAANAADAKLQLKRRAGHPETHPDVKALRDERDRNYQRAIKKALVAYGIAPAGPYGRPVMDTKPAQYHEIKGRDITWVVVYWEDQERIIRLRGEDRTQRLGPWKERHTPEELPAGITGADGVTTMVGTFRDADHLAFLLVHEAMHFEQYTDPKEADFLDDTKEKLAWQRTRDRVSSFIDPAVVEHYKNVADSKMKYYRGREKMAAYNKNLHGYGSAPPPVRQADELSAISARAQELEDAIHEEAFARHMLAVQALAEKACDDFWSLAPEDLAVGNFPPSDYDGLRCAYTVADSCRTKMLCDIIGRLGARWRIESPWLEERHWAVLASEPMGTPPTAGDMNTRTLPTAPIVRSPLFAAFDIARLAKIACSGGDYRKGLPEFSWFPDPSITMKQTPLSELGGCARSVYDKLMAANEKGEAGISSLPIDEWVSAASTPPPSSGSPTAPADNHQIDLSHPKQYIPSITPPRWH